MNPPALRVRSRHALAIAKMARMAGVTPQRLLDWLLDGILTELRGVDLAKLGSVITPTPPPPAAPAAGPVPTETKKKRGRPKKPAADPRHATPGEGGTADASNPTVEALKKGGVQ